MAIGVDDKVELIDFPEGGWGTVTFATDYIADVKWTLTDEEVSYHLRDLKLYESIEAGAQQQSEVEMEDRKYDVDQTVLDTGGMMLGHIRGFENTDTGVVYKVEWEDGRQTRNVQGVLSPVPEKVIPKPTPKDVKEVVTKISTRASEPTLEEYDPENVIEAWDLNFSLGNVIQHVYLAGISSPAHELEELTRAAFYLNRRIEKLMTQERAA